MFGVDKIALIRRAHFSDGKKIKEIVRELAVSRKVVRKVVRSGATDFTYIRQVQPRPQLGSFTDRLEALLAEDAARPRRDRRRCGGSPTCCVRRATRAATTRCAAMRGDGG